MLPSTVPGLLLQDELQELKRLAAAPREPADAELDDVFAAVTEAWNAAFFSGMTPDRLRRYLSFHLEGIRVLADSLYPDIGRHPVMTVKLIELIDYQREYFGTYFNADVLAPLSYCEKQLSAYKEQAFALMAQIEAADCDRGLKHPVLSYLSAATLSPSPSYSYRQLNYLGMFLETWKDWPLSTDECLETLTRIDFNHLGVFAFARSRIRTVTSAMEGPSKLAQLQEFRAALPPERSGECAYDPQWPSLRSMLDALITEETTLLLETLKISSQKTEPFGKLPLNLSVAQLALVVRLFFEEQIINSNNLSAVLKFIAEHFSTVRQANISSRSMSKECYSTSQVTAAVVRDILVKMTRRLDRAFFPVVIVINTITFFLVSTR
jgi:hypothetical protein